MNAEIETIEEEETEIPTEDIVEAIEAELEMVAADEAPGEPEGAPELELEPEVAKADEPEADPVETPAGEAEPEAEPAVAAAEPEADPPKEPEVKEEKPSDEFGTLEEGTPERTRERFEGLKTKFDETIEERDALIVERDQVKAESDQWVEAITGTGTNPEQFNMSLEYLRLVNSKDPKDLDKAYGIMEGELQELGRTLGKAAPGLDPIAAHPDLKQRVDDGLLDEADALEIVKARATVKFNETTTTAAAEETRNQSKVTNAYNDVKELGIELKARDPNFEAKVAILKPIIESVVTSGTPPEKWRSTIEATYNKIPDSVVAGATTPTPALAAVPNPIRPTGTSPSSAPMQAQPGSEFEAVTQALERGY